MNLHQFKEAFIKTCDIVGEEYDLPSEAIARDYYIVLMLEELQNSNYSEKCVFKGGTSLSKCFPKIIKRFSEDIDLTFMGMNESDKFCDKCLHEIIKIMTKSALRTDIVSGVGNARNKVRNVIFDENIKGIKLEIGSSVRPDPYSHRIIKSYIHEYLEKNQSFDLITKYDLKEVNVLVLNPKRTFIDKVMAIKRHAICGTLSKKVRHIYDVVKLYNTNEIMNFLNDLTELKRLLNETKITDSYYLKNKNLSIEYNSLTKYDFDTWKNLFQNENVKYRYEHLYEDKIVYKNEKLDFTEAINVFNNLNEIFKKIGE